MVWVTPLRRTTSSYSNPNALAAISESIHAEKLCCGNKW